MVKKMKWWAWLLIALIAILLIAAIYKSRTAESGTPVDYSEVSKRNIIETVSASGKIFPVTEVKISSDVSGEIVELPVVEGDSVRKGDVLALIDPDMYESQVRRGQAALSSARVQLAQARSAVQVAIAQKEQASAQYKNQQRTHNRNEELYGKGVISEMEYDNSLMSLETAEADFKSASANLLSREDDVVAARYNIESAEASLSELQTSLRKTTIHAPIDGVVSLLNVEQGERVVGTIQMSGDILMRIADFSYIEARVEVSENDILNVSIGDPAELEVEAYYGKVFRGKVTEIANSASNISTTTTSLTSNEVTNFIVKIGIDSSSYSDLIVPGNLFPFRPGMSCNVEIQTENKESVLSVPLAAVTTREKEDEERSNAVEEVVYIIQNDTAYQKVVTTGIQDRSYIEIRSGLSDGQKIVSGPYSAVSRELKDRTKVHQRKGKEGEE